MNSILSLDQLKQAVQLKEQIAALEAQLAAILDGNGTAQAGEPLPTRRRGRRPGKRATKGEATASNVVAPTPDVPAKKKRGGRRTMSPEAKARIAEAQKARWAKIRLAKGK